MILLLYLLLTASQALAQVPKPTFGDRIPCEQTTCNDIIPPTVTHGPPPKTPTRTLTPTVTATPTTGPCFLNCNLPTPITTPPCFYILGPSTACVPIDQLPIIR